MNCKYCNVPMTTGQALTPDKRNMYGWRVGSLVFTRFISFGGLRTVLKCPKCGYSTNQ